MKTALAALDRHWPWIALAISAAMLATAHYFERVEGLAPCLLCLKQREAYWAAGAIGLVGGLAGFTPWRGLAYRMACALLFVAFCYGTYLAIWHLGAEYKWWEGPAACAAGNQAVVTVDSIADMLSGGGAMPPSCEDPTPFLGLTMATWNAIVSFTLAAWSARCAALGRK